MKKKYSSKCNNVRSSPILTKTKNIINITNLHHLIQMKLHKIISHQQQQLQNQNQKQYPVSRRQYRE